MTELYLHVVSLKVKIKLDKRYIKGITWNQCLAPPQPPVSSPPLSPSWSPTSAASSASLSLAASLSSSSPRLSHLWRPCCCSPAGNLKCLGSKSSSMWLLWSAVWGAPRPTGAGHQPPCTRQRNAALHWLVAVQCTAGIHADIRRHMSRPVIFALSRYYALSKGAINMQ